MQFKNLVGLQLVREIVNLNSDGTPGLAYRNLIKPGDTVTFEAGKNLTVVQPSTDPAKFTFALNSKLEGITQVGGNGTTITFNQGGIGLGGDNAPKKITGVANGTDEHDAVNFGQLQNIIAANGSTETRTAAKLFATVNIFLHCFS